MSSLLIKLSAARLLVSRVLPMEYKAVKGLGDWLGVKSPQPVQSAKFTPDETKWSWSDVTAKIITGGTGLVASCFLIPEVKDFTKLKSDLPLLIVTLYAAEGLYNAVSQFGQQSNSQSDNSVDDVVVGGDGGCCGSH
jgi:hypothetical protein